MSRLNSKGERGAVEEGQNDPEVEQGRSETSQGIVKRFYGKINMS